MHWRLLRIVRTLVHLLAPAVWVPIPMRLQLMRIAGAQVGANVTVRAGFKFILGNVRLGDDVFLSDDCYFEDHDLITVGEGSWIGAGSALLSATHDIGPATHRAGTWRSAPVTIGAGCWLGARVTVLPGVTVGDGCVIAAGAVVTQDCEPNGLYAGVPAVRKRDLDTAVPPEAAP